MEACQREAEMRIQSAMASLSHLPQEIDSLKAVIELKNGELHELRHQNMELQREVRLLCAVVALTYSEIVSSVFPARNARSASWQLAEYYLLTYWCLITKYTHCRLSCSRALSLTTKSR